MSNKYQKQTEQSKSKQPTHHATIRHGEGDEATFERIGAAWFNENSGNFFIKLAGTQLVSEFSLIEIGDK